MVLLNDQIWSNKNPMKEYVTKQVSAAHIYDAYCVVATYGEETGLKPTQIA